MPQQLRALELSSLHPCHVMSCSSQPPGAPARGDLTPSSELCRHACSISSLRCTNTSSERSWHLLVCSADMHVVYIPWDAQTPALRDLTPPSGHCRHVCNVHSQRCTNIHVHKYNKNKSILKGYIKMVYFYYVIYCIILPSAKCQHLLIIQVTQAS